MATAKVLITDINFLIRGEGESKKIGSLMPKSSREASSSTRPPHPIPDSLPPKKKVSCQTSASQHDRLQMNALVDECVLREPEIFFIPHKTRYVEPNFTPSNLKRLLDSSFVPEVDLFPSSWFYVFVRSVCIVNRRSKSKNLNETKSKPNTVRNVRLAL